MRLLMGLLMSSFALQVVIAPVSASPAAIVSVVKKKSKKVKHRKVHQRDLSDKAQRIAPPTGSAFGTEPPSSPAPSLINAPPLTAPHMEPLVQPPPAIVSPAPPLEEPVVQPPPAVVSPAVPKSIDPAPVPAPSPAPVEPVPQPPRLFSSQPEAEISPSSNAKQEDKETSLSSGPWGVALKVGMLLPNGRTGDAFALANTSAEAKKALFAAGAVALSYSPAWHDRALRIVLEGGYYRLSGSGSRAFVNDPDFGSVLNYSWQMSTIPVLLGVSYRLPLPLPVVFAPSLGAAAVHAASRSTYEQSAGASVTGGQQVGWALGFYAGLEAALRLGPGDILLEARYINARTDLGLNKIYAGAYNKSPGDVEGTNILAGYRFIF